MAIKFSVLISVYAKEKPENLRMSLASVFRQTLKADEVLLVEDGPLTPELDEVIRQQQEQEPTLRTYVLEKNQGLGRALRQGLYACSYDIIARMDTDDICKPDRFEKQIAYLESHPEIDIVGGWADEFLDNPSEIVSSRRLPEWHEDIIRFGKKRNPLNHPTVMMRKQSVLRAGNYQHFYYFEDYYLWVRMIQAGFRFHNLQESLLDFRLSNHAFQRRGGLRYLWYEVRFQYAIFLLRYISLPRMCLNIVFRSLTRLMPNRIRQRLYLKVLRK